MVCNRVTPRKEEILAGRRGVDGVRGKKERSHKHGGKYREAGGRKRWRMDGWTDGWLQREKGRKAAWSQQGELMWAAEFEIVPRECCFFCHKRLFFFQQEKLSPKDELCWWQTTAALQEEGWRLSLATHTPKKHTIFYIPGPNSDLCDWEKSKESLQPHYAWWIF